MVNIALNSKKINNQNNIKKKRSDLYNKRIRAGEERPVLRDVLLKIGYDLELESIDKLEQLKKEKTFKIFVEFVNAKFSLKNTKQMIR